MNEEKSESGSCEETCAGKPDFCAMVVHECKCVMNFVRASETNRTCIPKNSCPCRAEEERKMGPICEKSCVPDPPGQMCPMAMVEGCYCLENYVRASEANRTCILKTSCPPVEA